MNNYSVLEHLDMDEECKEMLPDYPGFFITTKGRVWVESRQRYEGIAATYQWYVENQI